MHTTTTEPTARQPARANSTPAQAGQRPHSPPTGASQSTASTAVVRRRRWPRVVIATLAAFLLLGGAGYLWLSATATVQNLGDPDCRAVAVTGAGSVAGHEHARSGICTTLTGLAQAWAEHDADAYGAGFTEDATYTTFVGSHYTGREDIARSHRALFDGPLEGTQLADTFLGIDLVHEDVAVVTTRGDTYEGSEPEELTKVQTYTLVRQDDGVWLIASFHNTQRNPVMERVQFLIFPESLPAAER